MSLKPYPAYKATNSPLVGVIPTHWKATRLGSALSVKKDVVGAAWSKHLLLSLTLKGVIPRDMENRVGKLPAEFTTYQRVVQGDLIFCLFDVEETPRTVGWVPEEGMLTGAYTAACVAPFFDSRYIAYHYLSYDQRKSLRGYYAGLRNTIRSADFANIPIAFPPLEEQIAIVSYLDRETAEIDAFIADQEELIALLGERRIATITQAVTKGLDQDVAMKDSRVTWFDRIPSNWEISPLRRSISYLTSGSRDWASLYADSGTPFVRIGNLTRQYLSLNMDDTQFVDIAEGAEGQRSRLKANDVLFSITAYLGSVAVVDSETEGSYISQHIALVRPLPAKLNSRFLGYCVLSDWGQRQLSEQGYGGTKIQLSLADIKRFSTIVPPLREQEEIAAYLDQETAEIDAAIADAREAIVLSKERRAAAISAAVTGKIDVRSVKTPAATNVEVDSVGVA